jgi:hypothetical protein
MLMVQLAEPVLTARYLPTAPHYLRRESGSGLRYTAKSVPRSLLSP